MAVILSPTSIPIQATGGTFMWALKSVALGSTNETPLSLLVAGNKTIAWDLRRLVCLTTGAKGTLHLYADPAVSAPGTPVTPVNLRIGGPSYCNAKVYRDPTCSNYGTYINSLTATDTITSDILLMIDPGHSLLATVQVDTVNAAISLSYSWYEVQM